MQARSALCAVICFTVLMNEKEVQEYYWSNDRLLLNPAFLN